MPTTMPAGLQAIIARGKNKGYLAASSQHSNQRKNTPSICRKARDVDAEQIRHSAI